MTEFLEVVSSDELRRRLDGFCRMSAESISIDDAIGRYLAEDVLSPEDLPEHPRSTVDGYAVKANDTFGASDSLPALLRLNRQRRNGQATGRHCASRRGGSDPNRRISAGGRRRGRHGGVHGPPRFLAHRSVETGDAQIQRAGPGRGYPERRAGSASPAVASGPRRSDSSRRWALRRCRYFAARAWP